jgi:hypothetical protein
MTDASIAALAAIAVAMITSCASVAVAVVSSRRSRSVSRDAKVTAGVALSAADDALSTSADALEAIGKPNGKGTALEMLAKLLDGQTGQDQRLARIERNQVDHEARIRALEARKETGT